MNLNALQLRLVRSIIACSLVLCSCISNAAPQHSEKIIVGKNDLTPAQQAVVKFLKWYKVNLHKANSFPFLVKDSADNFMVNKSACSNYLNFLKSSQYISQKYMEYWKVFFDDKALELRDHPSQSDIPEGFEMDLVLITQEPELVLNKIDRIKFKTISTNNSVALIGVTWPGKDAMQYEFEMYKTKAGWQIGYISTPNFD
ncbi:MAG: hypothetical protein ABIP30_03600 [Ferruginibacter sp.]